MQKNRKERGIQKNIPKNYNLDDIISLGLIFLNKINVCLSNLIL